MSIELSDGEALVCPHCQYQYAENVEDVRIKDEFGIEGADREECPECGQQFLIIEYEEGQYSIEAAEDEDDDGEFYGDDD